MNAKLKHCKISQAGPPSAPWRVSWKDESGARCRKHFAKQADAKTFAADLDRDLTNHGRRFGSGLPPEVRLAWDYYRDTEAAGAPLPSFLDLVRGAADEHKRRHDAGRENTVAEVVERFLESKLGTAGAKQLADLKARLHRFASAYGREPIADIAPEQIENWLASLKSRNGPAAPLTRSHHRAAVGQLYRWACHPARRIATVNVVEAVAKPKGATAEPEAYTADEARRLLEAAREVAPELIAPLALQFFGGLRTSEVLSFNLDSIPAGATEFRVGRSKTRPRVIPVQPCLDAWLAVAPRRTGPAWAQASSELHRTIRAVHAAAVVNLIRNGCRHSYISHRAAVTRDPARVADEAANSVAVVRAHYRAIVSEAEGRRYFDILPAMPGENIVPLAAGL